MPFPPLPPPPRRVVRCSACDGTGKLLVMGEELCGYCAGSGRDLKEDLYAGYCPRGCNRGRIPYCRRGPQDCNVCHGKRVIEY